MPVLESLNLPVSTDIDAKAVIDAVRHDKKMSGNKITVIYVPEIGSYEMKKMPFGEFADGIKETFA